MRIVVDTNVLVSGMIHAEGPPGRIVDLLRSRALRLVVDERILSEYEDVLGRQRFARYFPPSAKRDILDFLRSESDCIACSVVVRDLPHAADAPFLEAALSASVPLVTGNARHFPQQARRGAAVLSPSEFCDRYADQLK